MLDEGPEHRPPLILAIDTSSAQAGIGLGDGQFVSARSWPAQRSHTTTVLAEIHHLLEAANVEVKDLAAVAVAVGPGAFTGLRVGLGVAKGFHLATGVPLIGVPTLEAAALPFAVCGREIVAAVAAGRGRLAWARYLPRSGALHELLPPRNSSVHELAALLAGAAPAIVTGEFDDEQSAQIGAIPGVSLVDESLRTRQPAAFLTLAHRRLVDGEPGRGGGDRTDLSLAMNRIGSWRFARGGGGVLPSWT